MNKRQLQHFIRIRNDSPFHSNLQFEIDAQTAGFTARDLGQAEKLPDGGYAWATPHGRLIERYGRLELE